MNVKWSLGVGGTIPWVFKNCFGHILVWMSFLACFTALLMDKRAGRFSPSGQKKSHKYRQSSFNPPHSHHDWCLCFSWEAEGGPWGQAPEKVGWETKSGEGMNFLRRWIPASNIPTTWPSLPQPWGRSLCAQVCSFGQKNMLQLQLRILLFKSRNLFSNSKLSLISHLKYSNSVHLWIIHLFSTVVSYTRLTRYLIIIYFQKSWTKISSINDSVSWSL